MRHSAQQYRPQGTLREVLVLCVACALLLGALLLLIGVKGLVVARDTLIIAIDSSPERMYRIGSSYLDTSDGRLYDPERAEILFAHVRAQNPSHPLVHHQLARIAFLRGDFEGALTLITTEITLPHTKPAPSSYYMKGLIEGFMGKYDDSALSYQKYIDEDPTNWAATNDLAWVLLKAGKYTETIASIDKVLPLWPENPWLLNSKATALFELGRLSEAEEVAEHALRALGNIPDAEWVHANPGNDPLIASQGMAVFRTAVKENIHTISLARTKQQQNVR